MMRFSSNEKLTFTDKVLVIMFLAGVFLVVGLIVGVCIVATINHEWILPSLSAVIPLIIAGLVMIYASAQLMRLIK